MILLCTDGYSNAFESPAGFEQVGGGDDVTVAVIFRDEPRPHGSGDAARLIAPTVLLANTPHETPTVLVPPTLAEPTPESTPLPDPADGHG